MTTISSSDVIDDQARAEILPAQESVESQSQNLRLHESSELPILQPSYKDVRHLLAISFAALNSSNSHDLSLILTAAELARR